MMNRKVILLVEDNEDDELLTLRAFRKKNVANRVDVCRNGADALDYVFRQGKYVDRDPREVIGVVMLDINLPKISGLEVLRRMRADPRTDFTPVVVLTSSKEEEDVIGSYRLGANSYLRKPVEFEPFLAAVGQLGMYWLMLNELPGEGLKADPQVVLESGS